MADPYRPDAPGITTRSAGEPCDHRHRVRYTDEGGLYARCQTCGHETINGDPIAAENAIPDPIRTGTDQPANGQPFVTCPICETHHYARRGAGTAVMVYARHYARSHQPPVAP